MCRWFNSAPGHQFSTRQTIRRLFSTGKRLANCGGGSRDGRCVPNPMTIRTFDIAVLPGDGIGREVMPACLELLAAAEKASGGPALRFTSHNAGAQYYLESGDALPASTLEACGKADAILFGAMGWPDVRFPDGTEIIPQLDLRMAFDLYAGVRPIRWFPGLPRILADERASSIDFVLVREQTEGLFYARGRGEVIEDREAYDTMQITRKGTSRAARFAFS